MTTCLHVVVVGLGLTRFLDFGFRTLKKKGYSSEQKIFNLQLKREEKYNCFKEKKKSVNSAGEQCLNSTK